MASGTLALDALRQIQNAFGSAVPDVAVVLGSGLGGFTNALSNSRHLSYSAIPGFPEPTVPGHFGECWLGTIGKKRVLVFRGRFHFYEGHSLDVVTLPVRLIGLWGIRTLVVTNAAGGIRKSFKPGTLMLIKDHLNLMGSNPLRGPNEDPATPRFPDLTDAYSAKFRAHAKKVAKSLKLTLPEGVYAANSGPSYETPAEVRMLGRMGADAVGMSTVPEVIVARHQGIQVLGISCITNHAAGVLGERAQKIHHGEVIEVGKQVEQKLIALLQKWISSYEN